MLNKVKRDYYYIKTYLWSMETKAKSNLCLLLNITSFCGISSKEGGPKGVQIAKSANGGSSDFRF